MSEGEAGEWEGDGGHYQQGEVGPGGLRILPALQVEGEGLDQFEELG